MPELLGAVVEAISASVRVSPVTPELKKVLIGLMSRRGRILADQSAAKWPQYVIEICRAFDGDCQAAVQAAALVEFMLAATDVIDDLVDEEWDGEFPASRALNATLALSALAQHGVTQLVSRLGTERAGLIARLVADGVLRACAGEDLDLLSETTMDVDEAHALEMARLKAGSLVAMACQVGAAVATDDGEILDAIAEFGEHSGIVAQLMNDLVGVTSDASRRGSDLRRRKKTLPIAFLLRCAREEGLAEILEIYERSDPLNAQVEQHLAELIRDLGGLHYTWVVAETHRRAALDVLTDLVDQAGRDGVLRLRTLVPATSPESPV